jgi:hypothetical protein
MEASASEMNVGKRTTRSGKARLVVPFPVRVKIVRGSGQERPLHTRKTNINRVCRALPDWTAEGGWPHVFIVSLPQSGLMRAADAECCCNQKMSY